MKIERKDGKIKATCHGVLGEVVAEGDSLNQVMRRCYKQLRRQEQTRDQYLFGRSKAITDHKAGRPFENPFPVGCPEYNGYRDGQRSVEEVCALVEMNKALQAAGTRH